MLLGAGYKYSYSLTYLLTSEEKSKREREIFSTLNQSVIG